MALPQSFSGWLAAIIVALVFFLVFWRVIWRMGVLLFLRLVARRALSDVGKRALEKQPDTIHLERLSEPQWKDGPAMETMAQALRECGFSDCGVFTVDKLPGVKVWILYQEETWVSAHLYEHPKVGFWPELVTRYTNGASHSITTRPASGIRLPDWITVIRSSQAPTNQLYQRLLKARSPSGIEHVRRSDVTRAFEDAYARQMIAQKNSGLSPEEVAAVMQKWIEKKAAGGA